jgi:lipopolysaccharide transport system ATP-binding protein
MTLTDTRLAVRAAGIGKQYEIGAAPGTATMYERVAGMVGLGSGRLPADAHPTIWALRDVSFEVAPGEVLGVMGRNGSGKSTLMRILARTTVPTEGEAETYGRVAALLDVGSGFHPDLSGRDNIKLSGAILGMSRDEVRTVHEAIIDFAEIGRFLDTPVKHYSSGMFLRLAFSVSIHLAAEIMLIDEILAVGDAAFQRKCQERIRQAVSSGRTVLFVSHSMASVEALCDRAMVLDAGRVRFSGATADAIAFYTREILGLAG